MKKELEKLLNLEEDKKRVKMEETNSIKQNI